MNFNEDSRVKLPALLTLTRLGFDYLSLKNSHKIDEEGFALNNQADPLAATKNQDKKVAFKDSKDRLKSQEGICADNKNSHKINSQTNIFIEIFAQSIAKINPHATQDEINTLLNELDKRLDYDDLGQSFYEYLIKTQGLNSTKQTNTSPHHSQPTPTRMNTASTIHTPPPQPPSFTTPPPPPLKNSRKA